MTPFHHGTLSFERALNHDPHRVFAAFAEVDARAAWAPPSPDFAMTFRETDFRVGGRDICVCGPGPTEGVTVETLYHVIEQDRRILFTEVVGYPGAPEAVGLVSVELTLKQGATQMKVTVQLTGLSPDAERDIGSGWAASIDNLERYLG